MAITDELREWMGGRVFMANGHAELTRIADRIDAAVRDKCATAYRDGFEDAEDAYVREPVEPRESGTDWKAEARKWEQRCKELIFDRDEGWVRLPVDADGVPIRVGDEIQYGNNAERVTMLSLSDSGWNLGTEYGDFDGVRVKGYAFELLDHPELFRHHRAPTVEDVLEEFVARWMETHHDDMPALKAEFAARLRLREENE